MADEATNQTTGDECDDDTDPDEECPHCDGEGMVWGCVEDTCFCADDDGLGCAPTRCDWCKGKG